MRTISPNANVGHFSLLIILPMLHILADDLIFTNPEPQMNGFDFSSGSTLDDPSARPLSNLLGPNDSKISSNLAIDEAILQTDPNPRNKNTDSTFLADASIGCPNRSRLRRSIHGKRDQSCKAPYSGTTTTTKPEGQQEDPPPEALQQDNQWPSKNELVRQLSVINGRYGVEYPILCRTKQRPYPICYPHNLPLIPKLVSPATMVEPCHICKGISLPCLPRIKVTNNWSQISQGFPTIGASRW